MGKNSFILYTEIWPAIQKLDMEQRGKLFTAIMKHALCEDPEKLDILTDVIFTFIASQMDRDSEKYQEVCARRAEYGRRGGLATAKQKLAKASKSKQNQANQADNDNENDNEYDNENDNENENEALAPLPPLSQKDEDSLREVAGERADGLIEDVRRYYSTHLDKRFPGWPIALAQFDSNQRRWGAAPKSKKMSPEERAIAAFLAEGEDDEARSE